MIGNILKKVFGSRNSRLLKEYAIRVKKINDLEQVFEKKTDHELKLFTSDLKKRYLQSKNLNELLEEAYAAVREASKRTLGLRHFDEQLLGGIALHEGKISEMKTGEGKTLVSTLPAYLNSLIGNPVYIVTVNDYLAERDSKWMGTIYEFLGLTVGFINSMVAPKQRKSVYDCDIIYGTNNELGFDYLRDNMAFSSTEKCQSSLSYAIIDEVDSVLIDEARTPLIISGSSNKTNNTYSVINKIIRKFLSEKNMNYYNLEEKQKSVSLTEEGQSAIENLLLSSNLIQSSSDIYSANNIQLFSHIDSSLKAHLIYKKDKDYVVENNEIVIIDEFTGRKMSGRRWSEGLHQAIEAKENVSIKQENQTYAAITFQNYFRMFDKISGMTGTADTEAEEFSQIYNLEVVQIPPHKKMIRDDKVDLVFLTEKEKYNRIINEIIEINKTKQPILVGTTSVESSEYISKILKSKKITHEVLNAKYHQKEAEIIENAGVLGSITIATNMAGRGTDIVLGGKKDQGTDEWKANNKKVKDLGGLYVIGTERHESRRIDNQLRGRSGRQGDPGISRFFLSLEDNLMRIFASDKVSEIMKKLGMEDGEAIEHKWVSKSIENAQKRVEAHNFDIRKTLLEYDDISNEQRKLIYQQRDYILNNNGDSLVSTVCQNYVQDFIEINRDELLTHDAELSNFNEIIKTDFLLETDLHSMVEDNVFNEEKFSEHLKKLLTEKIKENVKNISANEYDDLIKNISLAVIDEEYRNHLNSMDYLRQSIGLRGYAQKNPKNEFKRESFEMFNIMLTNITKEILKISCRIKIENYNTSPTTETTNKKIIKKSDNPECLLNTTNSDVPRNKRCPVTNMKFKQCCGKL
ncbi:MAG: preprotein translocase subunit SecA [Pseudomonadota bacterium]|nr:preprotein translocase subunit SecA [Pseudomonadota bacterium]